MNEKRKPTQAEIKAALAASAAPELREVHVGVTSRGKVVLTAWEPPGTIEVRDEGVVGQPTDTPQ